jgi:Dolichyl-phosphate-mannose-protein mannosyltransferase
MTEPTRLAWLQRGLLALPFLIGIAVLQGLTVEIDTFHGSDARVYQLPTILQLSERLDFSDYPSAQTPLYHVLTAWWGELVGFELWKLRLLNVLFSYGMALALLRLLRRATPLESWQAFALTLLFVLSPYVLGTSFTLLTDNLAILFALIALERVHAYSGSGSLAAFALACVAIAAALLTRQAFIWLAPVAAVFLLRGELRAPGRLLAGAAMLALALVPLGLLALEWNGLVPPSADPASCGLCDDRQGLAREALTLRTVGFTVALGGAYGALVFGPGLVRRLRRLRSSIFARAYVEISGRADALRRGVAIAAGVGVLLLVISPLLYKPITPQQAGDAGYLWQLSDRFPELFGSSLLFWALVPLGCIVLYLLVRRAGIWSLPAVYLACFLLAALPVRLVYQKYFDPFMLLALALLARPPDLRTRWDYAGIGVLYVAFVAYAFSFAD